MPTTPLHAARTSAHATPPAISPLVRDAVPVRPAHPLADPLTRDTYDDRAVVRHLSAATPGFPKELS